MFCYYYSPDSHDDKINKDLVTIFTALTSHRADEIITYDPIWNTEQ